MPESFDISKKKSDENKTFKVSQNTLKMMDESIKNYKSSKVGAPISLSVNQELKPDSSSKN